MSYKRIYLSIFFLVFVWSAIQPKDYFTWALEVFPAIIGLVVIWKTNHRFPLTKLAHSFLLLHCCILFVGGHYTYAEVPLFDMLKEWFNQTRNNYDKVGHFAQGFVPALLAREILIRRKVIAERSWLAFIVVSICLSISAAYEFLEWGVAVYTGENADAFLGTQGYAWDTQSDMLYATCGAISMLLLLSKAHDRELERISKTE